MPWMIYRHISPSGKSYIGQTNKTTLEERTMGGRGYTCGNAGRPTPFLRAIRKYGWKNFTSEILESNIPTQEIADEKERYM